MCGIGENSTTGMSPCEPCPMDTYADEPGTILCTPCPEGTTTEGIDQNGTGAYDAWDCRGMSIVEATLAFCKFLTGEIKNDKIPK